MRRRAALAGMLLLAACRTAADDSRGDAGGPNELRSAYAQAEHPDAGWSDADFSDPAAWRVVADDGRAALELFQPSAYAPPFRSPLSVALLTEYWFGDFTLDVDVRQTGREYGHRDLCLFFGWQAPDRFYYAHLSSTPDRNAHNVFLVDGADRRNLLPAQPHGVVWGDGWHHLRLERRASDGLVRVFFDSMDAPVLEAVDEALSFGRVGFGSFDDTGRFANAEIRAGSAMLLSDAPAPFAPYSAKSSQSSSMSPTSSAPVRSTTR